MVSHKWFCVCVELSVVVKGHCSGLIQRTLTMYYLGSLGSLIPGFVCVLLCPFIVVL